MTCPVSSATWWRAVATAIVAPAFMFSAVALLLVAWHQWTGRD
jgi:hypothetical protein